MCGLKCGRGSWGDMTPVHRCWWLRISRSEVCDLNICQLDNYLAKSCFTQFTEYNFHYFSVDCIAPLAGTLMIL